MMEWKALGHNARAFMSLIVFGPMYNRGGCVGGFATLLALPVPVAQSVQVVGSVGPDCCVANHCEGWALWCAPRLLGPELQCNLLNVYQEGFCEL